MITISHIDPIRLDLAARGLIAPENKAMSTPTSKRHGQSGALVFDLTRDCYFDHTTQRGGGYVELARSYGVANDRQLEPAKIKASPEPSDAERTAKPLENWGACDGWQHSPVERYLESRGIDTLHLFDLGWHPALAMHIDGKFQKVPAMVAKITDALTDEFLGIHRTALAIEGGKVSKLKDAQGKSVKRMLGKTKGGVVKLDDRNPKAKTLAVAEGLESACSAIQLGFPRTWACLSAGGMKSLPIIPDVEELIIFPDNDKNGLEAARVLAKRYLKAGVPVTVYQPKDANSDANDVLREAA